MNRRASWPLSLLRAVKLLGNKFPVPGKNRVGFDNRRHLLQRLLAQLLADFGERLALAVVELDAPFDLLAQDAILCHQVLIAQEELLIH